MFVKSEHSRSSIGRVAADALKHAKAILHRGTDKRDHAFTGGPQRIMYPYVASCTHVVHYNDAAMETGLRNRVAIVAASSQGIGRAAAEAFAAEGCRLAICARNREALNAVAEKIRSQHKTEVLAEPFDVTDASAVRDFVSAVVQQFGSADVCVTNAGGPPAKGFLATTTDEWKRAVEVNFMSAVYFAHQVIPHMQKKQWGRIITITSITTKQPVADLVLSNAVRAAVVGLVKSLAKEVGKDGILVNNVGPGYTATDRLKELAKARSIALGKKEEEI